MLRLFKPLSVHPKFTPIIPKRKSFDKNAYHTQIKNSIASYADMEYFLNELQQENILKADDYLDLVPEMLETCNNDRSLQKLNYVNDLYMKSVIDINSYDKISADLITQISLVRSCREKCERIMKTHNVQQNCVSIYFKPKYIFSALPIAFLLCMIWVK